MTDYYVKNGGNNDLAGTSDGTAWATIAKVNGESFSGDDAVYFNRDDTWEGTVLVFPSSGTSGHQITIGAYGTGADPIITIMGAVAGWTVGGNWTQVGATDVWYITLTYHPIHLLLDDTLYTEAEDAVSVTATYRWFWHDGTDRLYVYATESPEGLYSDMDVRQDARTVDINNQDYLTIEDIDIQAGLYALDIRGGSTYVFVDSCTIGKYADGGVRIIGSNNKVYDCTIDSGILDESAISYGVEGGDGVLIHGTGSSADSNFVYDNTISNWGHTAMSITGNDSPRTANSNEFYGNEIDGSYSNYLRGAGCVGTADDICSSNKFYRNYIHDTTVNSQIHGNLNEFYYNIIDTVTECYLGEGYSDGVDFFATAGNKCHDNKFYNNIIYNVQRHCVVIGEGADSDITGLLIRNNIFMNWGTGDYGIISLDEASITGSTFENNCFYKSGVTDVVYNGQEAGNDYARTAAEFNGDTGEGGNTIADNISGDPLMVDPSNAKFSLQGASPCIGTGVDVSLTEDYLENPVPINTTFDIGAYEYVGLPMTTQTITSSVVAPSVTVVVNITAGMGLTLSMTLYLQ